MLLAVEGFTFNFFYEAFMRRMREQCLLSWLAITTHI